MTDATDTLPFSAADVRGISTRPVRGYCSHRDVLMDEARRMLQCKTCECWLEPFDWLYKHAREVEAMGERERRMGAEIVQLKNTMVELKREITNLKRQRQRAKA